MDGLETGEGDFAVDDQASAADFAEDFGVGAEFNGFLGVDAAGDGAFDDEAAAMDGGAEEGALFVNGDIPPGADALGAALADFDIAEVDEGAAVRALGGGGAGGGLVDRLAVEADDFAPALDGGVEDFRVFAAAGDDVSLFGADSVEQQGNGDRAGALWAGGGGRRVGFSEAPEATPFQDRRKTGQFEVLPAVPAIRRKPAGGLPLPGAAMRAFDFDFFNQRSVLLIEGRSGGPLNPSP